MLLTTCVTLSFTINMKSANGELLVDSAVEDSQPSSAVSSSVSTQDSDGGATAEETGLNGV